MTTAQINTTDISFIYTYKLLYNDIAFRNKMEGCGQFCYSRSLSPDSKFHGTHMGPVGPSFAPCWPHRPCYRGRYYVTCSFLSCLTPDFLCSPPANITSGSSVSGMDGTGNCSNSFGILIVLLSCGNIFHWK